MKLQKTTSHKIATVSLLPALVLFSTAALVVAQEKVEHAANGRANAEKPSVIFKFPGGHMPGDFPEHKAGKVLLNAKRPSGMFIVYPKEGESSEALFNQLKSMVAGMFFHDAKTQVNWTTSPLPAHQGVNDESGILSTASNEQMEVQLAEYTRRFGETTIVYGYFAMRHKGTPKSKDDGKFLDGSGSGVEEFDKFWKSIRASK